MPNYRFTKKSTGKTYVMPWDDADNPPSKADMDQYAWEQENPTLKQRASKVWDSINTPLADLRGGPDSTMRKATDQFAADHPIIGGGANLALDTISGMSSPLSVGLIGAEVASPLARAAGLGKTAKALKTPGRLAAGGMVAHGGYRVYNEPTVSGKLGGGLEMALGGLGLRNTPLDVDAKSLPDISDAPGPKRLGKGRVFRQGPSSLTEPIDAEFSEIPQGQFPPTPDRPALPPAVEPDYYSGRRGTSSSLGDVEEPLKDARTPEAHAFNALIPERYKPYPSSTGIGSHFEPLPDLSDEAFTGVRPEEGTSAGIKENSIPQPKSSGAFTNTTDTDVAFLAESGDKDALLEAQSRPSLRDRFSKLLKNEKGAVGDQSGPQNVDELSESLQDESGRPIAPKPKTPPLTGAELDVEGRDLSDQGRSAAQPTPTSTSWFRQMKDKLTTDENGFVKITKKGQNPYLDRFADWVNNLKSTKIEGLLKRREFADLDNAGFDAIHAYQAGDRSGRLANVQQYFQDKLSQLHAAGVKLGERENYLPQLWEDDPAVVKETYRRLGLRPSFTQKRIFEDYVAGVNAGLKPKFKTIGDLVGWYEQKANKAIADRQFYNLGREQGWIRPQGKGEPDWKILDPNHFPTAYTTSSTGVIRQIPMTAPPEMHELISNYLGDPNKVIGWMADKASIAKNLTLSSGIPGTGINAHGLNIMARTIMGNPKQALTMGKYLIAPSTAEKALNDALNSAPWAVKRGLQLTTEGHEMGVTGSTNLAGRTLNKFLKVQGKFFEDPLFQKVIPAAKLKQFNDLVDDLVKGGMERNAAGTEAAKYVNNLYGGINWEAEGRSRDIQNFARIVTLAPDWLESNIRNGAGMSRLLSDPRSPQGKLYAKMARNILAAYVAADAANYGMNGRHMWENKAGHALDIDAGKSADGKERWIRPFGTAADFLRLPFDMASAAFQNNPDFGSASDIAKNRLSIPGRVILDLVTKRDRMNRPILGKDDYGRPLSVKRQVGGVAGELSSLVTPPYVKSVIDYSTGAQGAEEAAAGAMELPMRYTKPQKFRRLGRAR